jgi:hypothetical protein
MMLCILFVHLSDVYAAASASAASRFIAALCALRLILIKKQLAPAAPQR